MIIFPVVGARAAPASCRWRCVPTEKLAGRSERSAEACSIDVGARALTCGWAAWRGVAWRGACSRPPGAERPDVTAGLSASSRAALPAARPAGPRRIPTVAGVGRYGG